MDSFGSGINITGGVPQYPGVRFLNSPSSGLFSFIQHTVGISSYGQICVMFDYEVVNFFTDIRIQRNAKNGAVLTSDANGLAKWQINNVAGTYQWNKIFKNLDLESQNNSTEIVLSSKLSKIPTIIVTNESDIALDDTEFFIRDKTDTSFTLYSKSFMTKKIISEEFTYYSTNRLSNGGIGICYYSVINDRMKYIYSDKDYKTFSDAITIDDVSAIGICDMKLVDGYPAIVYIVDDGSEDKWRYVRANDALGATWNTPITLETSVEDITFLSNAVFLRVVNGLPIIFYNNDRGRAKYFKSQDATGILWNVSANLSNLTNHQIVGVEIIDNNPAVIARSNITKYIYYVRSNNSTGTSWPIGATQLYKPSNVPMEANIGDCCNTIAIIHGSLYIITSEANSNSIYIIKANDSNGSSWGNYQFLANSSTTSAYPYVFKNGNDYYILYNSYTGTPSKKNIIRIQPNDIITSLNNECFVESLSYCLDHQAITNDDTSNILLISSEQALTLLKFYGNDFKVNWAAIS
ncbi:MAG: hypothetical protein ACRCZI_13070 [Cetobacterium sp.]